MSRAVRRRQKRRSDAVNRAIDEAIEKLYVATGLNTNGKRGGRLKKRGRERDADVLVAIGNPTFGNVRGRAPAAPKALVTTLAKRYRTFTLSERNTSKCATSAAASSSRRVAKASDIGVARAQAAA